MSYIGRIGTSTPTPPASPNLLDETSADLLDETGAILEEN